MIIRILSLLSVPLMAFTIWGIIRQVRREQPIGLLTPTIGLVMAPLTLAINLIFMRAAYSGWIGPAMLALGLGLGLAWGQTTRLTPRGRRLVARRSILHLIFWAVSYAITQILAIFAPAAWPPCSLVPAPLWAPTSTC